MSENITDPPQQSDLLSIGAILRKKREEHSYTLEHVSEITRITLTCLRNIEEGNLDALPGLVFVRGFIRNYAKLLGLESDWMIEALNQTYSDRTQPNSDSDQPRSFNPLSQPDTRFCFHIKFRQARPLGFGKTFDLGMGKLNVFFFLISDL